jgi:hypothetical protein
MIQSRHDSVRGSVAGLPTRTFGASHCPPLLGGMWATRRRVGGASLLEQRAASRTVKQRSSPGGIPALSRQRSRPRISAYSAATGPGKTRAGTADSGLRAGPKTGGGNLLVRARAATGSGREASAGSSRALWARVVLARAIQSANESGNRPVDWLKLDPADSEPTSTWHLGRLGRLGEDGSRAAEAATIKSFRRLLFFAGLPFDAMQSTP